MTWKQAWKPEWELCEESQCDIHIGPADYDFHSVHTVLQRCKTEDGNWIYMVTAPAGENGQGSVSIAVEQVDKTK